MQYDATDIYQMILSPHVVRKMMTIIDYQPFLPDGAVTTSIQRISCNYNIIALLLNSQIHATTSFPFPISSKDAVLN